MADRLERILRELGVKDEDFPEAKERLRKMLAEKRETLAKMTPEERAEARKKTNPKMSDWMKRALYS